MSLRPSRLLKLIRDHQIATVFKANLSEPRVLEIAGLCGVDAIWLCQEHVPNDWIGIENQIRAARIHNVDTLVRVSKGAYSDYVRPLEADATGIIVPHVASVDEARQIVDWVRFHPLGRRAMDGGNNEGRYCLTPVNEYIKHANTERIVVLQIESPEALEHVEAIAAVPGFDGIMFGPGDFSHRIGKAGQIDAPEVVAARQRVAEAARRHGKFAMSAGLIAPLPDLAREGHRVICIGADVIGLATYVKQRLELIRGQIEQLPADLKPAARSPYA
jgi:4-hydroxy-2-oxoheptanedioate aldolase